MGNRGLWTVLLPEGVVEDSVREYCLLCRRESRGLGKPSPRAMDCWKIIIEVDGSYGEHLVDLVKGYLGEYRGCWAEYRFSDDRLIMLVICRGWSVMWGFREKLINDLLGAGILDKPYLPYRRGGSYYDREYGPWRLWARDYYPERLPVIEIGSAMSICPFDGAVMEYTGRGLKCGLCGLYIPETMLYEVLENGVGEYVPRQGFYRDRVFILKYMGSDRFVVEVKEV